MNLSTNALTTVQSVKDELGIVDTSNDALLTRMINSVSDFLEHECDRRFELNTYSESYFGTGRQYLLLNQFPIVSVTSVVVDENTIDPTAYDVEPDSGRLHKVDLWPMRAYLVGLVGEPEKREKNIQVNYTAGYVLPQNDSQTTPRTLPYDLEDACIQLVAYRFRRRGSQHVVSEGDTDYKAQYTTEGVNADIRRVITSYSRKGVF